MTTIDFAKQISTKSVDVKLSAAKNISECIATGKNPDQSPMTEKQKKGLEQLRAWLGVSIVVGDELCPPETLYLY